MPEWLERLLPDVVLRLLTPTVLWVLSVSSLVMFVASLVAIPWLVCRIPADYFTRRDTLVPGARSQHPVLRWVWLIARNVAGVILLLAGIAMLVLPGQGLISIFVALFLIDFPRKRVLQRRLIASGPLWRGINALRQRAGHPVLERPQAPSREHGRGV